MRSIRAVPAFFLLLTFTCTCVAVSPGEIKREEIEWCDVWMPNMTRTDKPRVMLIGDSITRGYFKDVEEGLKGKAYCARVATSKAIGDPALLVELTTFLAEAKFDVVHFNVGMHGWDYTEQEYRQHLPELLRAIREAAPEAKLIWASTTPVRKDRLPGPDNRRIEERNAIAREYFTRQRIPIDDLYTLMLPQADLHSDDVHFNAEGCSLLAEQVAREVARLLP